MTRSPLPDCSLRRVPSTATAVPPNCPYLQRIEQALHDTTPPYSAKVQALAAVLRRHSTSRGIVFVERTAMTLPLARAIDEARTHATGEIQEAQASV